MNPDASIENRTLEIIQCNNCKIWLEVENPEIKFDCPKCQICITCSD